MSRPDQAAGEALPVHLLGKRVHSDKSAKYGDGDEAEDHVDKKYTLYIKQNRDLLGNEYHKNKEIDLCYSFLLLDLLLHLSQQCSWWSPPSTGKNSKGLGFI